MSDLSAGGKVFAAVVVASLVGLGIAGAIADHSQGHRAVPLIPGKYGWVVWAVAEVFRHPMIRISALVAVAIGVGYFRLKRLTGAGDPGATSAPTETSTVRCHSREHVQVVPVGQSTFACERCSAKLKRGTRERAAGKTRSRHARNPSVLSHRLASL